MSEPFPAQLRDGARVLLGAMTVALAILASFVIPQTVAKADPAPAVELVLAVDVSGSVSAERFELQRRGYAAAFRDPRVIRAIRAAGGGGIAVTMTQWTGPHMQAQIVPWLHMQDEAAARRMAEAIETAPRIFFSGGTSVSGAIDHAVRLLSDRPSGAMRRVIDISGDGANNRGRPATDARDAAVASNIIINGLPILALEPNLESYYRDNVIGGPGAFVIAAKTYEAFGEAIVRKLVLEIAQSEAPLEPPAKAATELARAKVADTNETIAQP